MTAAEMVNRITKGLIVRLAPFGWQVDWAEDKARRRVTYYFKLRVGVAGHPFCGEVLGQALCLTEEALLRRPSKEELDLMTDTWARDVLLGAMQKLTQPLPPAPEPPEWRPAEAIPEDFYTA